jgi:uncharacterized protein with PIN domain
MTRLYADRMLGKLARLLRMTGQDVEYRKDGDADEILARAQAEGRVLLTRDKKLLGRASQALHVESNYPFHQARQVLTALGLTVERQFSRCVEDNGTLVVVDRREVGNLPPAIQAGTSPIYRCDRCAKTYWEGTHVEAMRDLIASLEGAPLILEPNQEAEPEQGLQRLEPLLDFHQALEVLLLRHRLALMRTDLSEATRAFRHFAALLNRHLADEEDLVLPPYEANPPAEGYERGAGPTVFRAEHQNILGHLLRLEGALAGLAEVGKSELPVACLKLLDREKVFADLLEHHDLRERQYLYPALERLLGEEEKLELLERMVGATFKESA